MFVGYILLDLGGIRGIPDEFGILSYIVGVVGMLLGWAALCLAVVE